MICADVSGMPSSASASEGQVSLRGWLALALCAVLVLLAGCASRIPDTVDIPYTPEQLLPARAPFMGPEDAQELVPVDLLALDAEMRAFLAEIEQRSGYREKDVIALMRRQLKPSSFRLWRKRVSGRGTKHQKRFAKSRAPRKCTAY